MKIEPARLPAVSGSYLLGLYLPRRTVLEIGRLGRHLLARGWYYYCGSACGPGGLRGRLRHHLQPATRPHWHIDYLCAVGELRQIWYQPGGNREHHWTRQLAAVSAGSCPLPGFGSSDCRCCSHLVYFSRRPQQRQLRAWLGGDAGLTCGTVQPAGGTRLK